MRRVRLYSCALGVSVLLAAACGSSGGGTSPSPSSPTPSPAPAPAPAPVPTTTLAFEGIFASGLFTGTVTMTAQVPVTVVASSAGPFHPLATVTATGTAKFTGTSTPTTNLTGSYETSTSTFTLKGGNFTVDAAVTENAVFGTVRTGDGKEAGLAAMPSAAVKPVSYCGTFRGDSTGKLNIVINSGNVRGVAAQDGESEPIHLRGTADSQGLVHIWWTAEHGFRGDAYGQIEGNRLTGNWSNTDGEKGTWSGSNTGC